MNEMAQPSVSNAYDSSEISGVFTQVDFPRCTASVDSSSYKCVTDDAINEIIENEMEEAAHSTCC